MLVLPGQELSAFLQRCSVFLPAKFQFQWGTLSLANMEPETWAAERSFLESRSTLAQL
jgi:hypothetical protein